MRDLMQTVDAKGQELPQGALVAFEVVYPDWGPRGYLQLRLVNTRERGKTVANVLMTPNEFGEFKNLLNEHTRLVQPVGTQAVVAKKSHHKKKEVPTEGAQTPAGIVQPATGDPTPKDGTITTEGEKSPKWGEGVPIGEGQQNGVSHEDKGHGRGHRREKVA